MVHQITNGIKVSVETHFEGTFYNKEIIQFAFSYVVKIKNERQNPVQLLSRTWHICDALNSKGAFSNEGEVLDWRIEFYAPDGSEVLFTHHHLVEGSNVLLFVSFNGDSGKIDLNLLFEYANSLKQRGVSRVYCFMDESYKYDLESGGITPLRFNQHLEDRIEFSYVLNKTF